MLSHAAMKKIRSVYDGRPLVIEGANGSMGLSISTVLREIKIKPSKILLTTFKSAPHSHWVNNHDCVFSLKSVDSNFQIKRREIIESFGDGVNVIYGAGYGRPNMFLADGDGVINSNVGNLLAYSEFKNILSLAYMSSSELYTGSMKEVNEESPLLSTPQHPRGIYIEAKRLGESIVSNILSKTIGRVAVYRIALATPPMMLENDGRVLADLIKSAMKNKSFT